MSTTVEQTQPKMGESEFSKLSLADPTQDSKSQQHPLHTYDLAKMSKFYEACVTKLSEQNPKWKPTEWIKSTPIPNNLSSEEQKRWANPVVISEKQRVYECFAKLARDLGEPMILMPNFDISDLQNFELFLDSLKTDGVNAVRKYKQFLLNKDMRKQEVDLVCVHARYGIILVECKEADYVDNRRRSRAKVMIGQTKSLFKALGRLIAESKGWPIGDASVPVLEFVALPNVQERPVQYQPKPAEPSAQPQPSQSRTQLGYLIKSDLENHAEFMRWWSKSVVEPRLEQEKLLDEQKKTNRFDWTMLNSLVALVNCIKSNSILPVVYPESGSVESWSKKDEKKDDDKKDCEELKQFQPALNIHAEFFRPKHEQARALSKCLVLSREAERLRKTLCLQTLWLLLNDSSKKISVVCSELNKPYYEEFFARQRKVHSNLNNVRFYTDLHSCGDPSTSAAHTNTLKKDGEVWFFDACGITNANSLNDVLERAKQLNSWWVFSSEPASQHKDKMSEWCAKLVDLDEDKKSANEWESNNESWNSIKLPLRLHCDLLIVGDMISASQLKFVYKFLQSKSVPSQARDYQPGGHHYGNHQPMQQLNFNPAKKFRSVKFIRGGTIDNIRNAIKMHDSIQAQCVVVHVGDEDVFKTRNSVATIEPIKELAQLVREYCPKSFVVLSTLMRRMSRTENQVTHDVNKGIVSFCKATRESLNCYYMHNGHFEPDYHTQGGRLLNNRGLKQYVDNILFVVDYFLIKNNKQH